MPVLPLCASAGQSSSSTDVVPWNGGQCIILTPDCLRDTVQKNMKTPGCVKIPKPDRESMTCTNLLQYHAQSLLDSHLYPAEKRKRITQKQAVSDNELLHQLVKDPMKVIIHYKMDWAEKRRLHGFVAHITAFHYGIRVVEARAAIKDLWRDVTKDKLHNWKLLESRFETPVLSSEGKNDDEPDVQELYGGIFTWHTLLGRNSGVIARLFAVGCKLDVIAEAAACDPDIRREWQCFVLWLNAIAQSHGFDCTAMCMELCAEGAKKSRVHLHAFLGRDSRLWRTPQWTPVTVSRKQFQYENFLPNIRKTLLRNASNPTKQMNGGMWYCLAPKIGSIFRFSKKELFKDTCCKSVVHRKTIHVAVSSHCLLRHVAFSVCCIAAPCAVHEVCVLWHTPCPHHVRLHSPACVLLMLRYVSLSAVPMWSRVWRTQRNSSGCHVCDVHA